MTLHNFAVDGKQLTVGPFTTNASGQVTFNVALHPKIISGTIKPHKPIEVRVFVSPTLIVELDGFNTLTMTLLTDDGEID